MKHITGKPELTAHQKLIRAAAKGKGLHLNADDVMQLVHDDAVLWAALQHSARFQNCTSWEFREVAYSEGHDVPYE